MRVVAKVAVEAERYGDAVNGGGVRPALPFLDLADRLPPEAGPPGDSLDRHVEVILPLLPQCHRAAVQSHERLVADPGAGAEDGVPLAPATPNHVGGGRATAWGHVSDRHTADALCAVT